MALKYHILELYSGIGGMHCALKESSIEGNVIAAVDINTVANQVYAHNFPETNLINRNIQSMSSKYFNELKPDIIMMSPPCQPFTRNGLQNDIDDPRTDSFEYVLSILKELHTVKYLLLENVKGFETSKMREMLVKALKDCDYFFMEFMLHPYQFGVPNSRLRYYCLARKKPFSSINNDELLYDLPQYISQKCFSIDHIIEKTDTDSYKLPLKYLKRAFVLDICYPDSDRSCCFTKAYTHFLDGAGSVFTESDSNEVKSTFEICKNLDTRDEKYTELINNLNLRFFTPREVLRLMMFPEVFSFPNSITNRQKYRLIGNSINVKVVSNLLQFLINS